MLLMRYFCVLVFSKILRIEYIPPDKFFFTFNCFVFFCFHVLNLFVGWGVLIWKKVAFLGHGVVPFDNIFPKKSRKKKKKNEKACSYILSLSFDKKGFSWMLKEKKISKKNKKMLVDAVLKELPSNVFIFTFAISFQSFFTNKKFWW